MVTLFILWLSKGNFGIEKLIIRFSAATKFYVIATCIPTITVWAAYENRWRFFSQPLQLMRSF